MDGFEVLRRGDVNVDCRILLHVAHQPERFKVLPPLNDLIGVQEGTRSDVMSALWKLIKVAGAQDKEDATVIRPVGGLEKVGEVSMAFADRRSCPKVYSFINFPSWRPAS